MDSYRQSKTTNRDHAGVFSTLWNFTAVRFQGVVNSLFAFNIAGVAANITDCFKAVGWALTYHFFYSLIFYTIAYVVMTLAGGALCRISALQFAKGEKPGLGEAGRFSLKNFSNLLVAPLVPIGIIVFVGLFVFLLGVIGNIPWFGELIAALSMPLTLLAGVVISVLLIGTVAGFNLMFPAVAYDGADSFDALSRSYNYIFAEPWRMALYTTVAAGYGAICYTFVRLFGFLIVFASWVFLQLGMFVEGSSKQADKISVIWPQPRLMNLLGTSSMATTNWSESVAAFVVRLSVLVVIGLVASFILSFYFSSNTIIYSLMRKRVDHTSLEEVYTCSEDIMIEPAGAESEPEEAPAAEETAPPESEGEDS